MSKISKLVDMIRSDQFNDEAFKLYCSLTDEEINTFNNLINKTNGKLSIEGEIIRKETRC